jgi:hypothetical protein
LLQKGLLHLEQSKMLEDAASASHDLSTSALHEAVRKQTEVVAELEQLLAILLDRALGREPRQGDPHDAGHDRRRAEADRA